MRLFVEFFSADLHKARAFFVDALGLQPVRDDADYVVLRDGQLKINLCDIANLEPDHYLLRSGGGLGVAEYCLEVEDQAALEKAFARAKAAGAVIAQPIRVQPWHRADFRLIAPDGQYIRVTTPQAAAHGSASAQSPSQPRSWGEGGPE